MQMTTFLMDTEVKTKESKWQDSGGFVGVRGRGMYKE